MSNLHVKKGDTVKILAGKDRGKEGKIMRSLPSEEKVVVEGINLMKKHQRARKQGEKGGIFEKPMPIHVSNVKKVSK